jgi:hypothetical protein
MADRGTTLLSIARAAIARQLGISLPADTSPPWLREPAATFVTLRKNDELRGCIGTLEANRDLLEDVRENAVAAAFRDPRFPPLSLGEWPEVVVEVSELTPAVPMQILSEDDAMHQLRPGLDGVILEYDGYRGTFLPQVWETLPDRRQFLRHLKLKAGLPADFWNAGIRLSRYTVSKWNEERRTS